MSDVMSELIRTYQAITDEIDHAQRCRISLLERQLAESQQRHAVTEREACSRAADAEELRRQLEEARGDAAFSKDQLEVALKDRDYAERQLVEARAEIERLKRLNNEYRLAWNAAEDQLIKAHRVQPDDHPTPAEGQCVSTASVEAPGPAGSYAAAAEIWSG